MLQGCYAVGDPGETRLRAGARLAPAFLNCSKSLLLCVEDGGRLCFSVCFCASEAVSAAALPLFLSGGMSGTHLSCDILHSPTTCPTPLSSLLTMQAVPPQWVPLSDRAYRIALGDNAQMCGDVPPPLASAVLAAGSSARGSSLGQPCSWQADSAALLRFKAAVSAVPAAAAAPAAQHGVVALADWQESSNPCTQSSWTGVSCRGGRVAILNLANAGLRLPTLEPLSALGALQKVLLAGNNAANATLPASWAALGQLEVADLAGTGIRGTLPPSWTALRSLKQLRLRGNALSGTLPDSWEMLGNLAEL